MAIKNLTEMSREELLKEQKTTTFVAGLLGGALLMALALNIFTGIKKGFNISVITPFALLPILFIIFSRTKEIKKELESRNDVI